MQPRKEASWTVSQARRPPCTARTVRSKLVTPTKNPEGIGFWQNPELWTQEVLARDQATDSLFDGVDGSQPDGLLSASEVQFTLSPGGNMDKMLKEQLLATYLNLATHRIDASTKFKSSAASRLGLTSVRAAIKYAQDTLALPVTTANRDRYSDATKLLDEINLNQSEVY